MRRKMPMPMPVTVGDCLLLHQMGYRIEINDGRVTAVIKESKKKKLDKASNYKISQFHCITDAVRCQEREWSKW